LYPTALTPTFSMPYRSVLAGIITEQSEPAASAPPEKSNESEAAYSLRVPPQAGTSSSAIADSPLERLPMKVIPVKSFAEPAAFGLVIVKLATTF
jgi:hypothetical protein